MELVDVMTKQYGISEVDAECIQKRLTDVGRRELEYYFSHGSLDKKSKKSYGVFNAFDIHHAIGFHEIGSIVFLEDFIKEPIKTMWEYNTLCASGNRIRMCDLMQHLGYPPNVIYGYLEPDLETILEEWDA